LFDGERWPNLKAQLDVSPNVSPNLKAQLDVSPNVSPPSETSNLKSTD
jgi:hypothetical protein